MNVTLIVVTALMAAVTLAAILWIAASAGEGGAGHDELTVTYDHGDAPVITVRSADGRTVTVRTSPPHVLDEDDETDLLPAGPEAAREAFPDLYDEYMAEGTGALRRYEIADIVCDAGFVLPWHRGLHEEYLREMASAGGSGGSVDVGRAPAKKQPLREIAYRVFEEGPAR